MNFEWHSRNCVFFTSIRSCGRLLCNDGAKYEPRRIDEMEQFVRALQWEKTAIHQFTFLVEPLHLCLENRTNGRARHARSKMLLTKLGRGKKKTNAFNCWKTAHQITLADRGRCQRLFVYTDASDFSSQISPLRFPVWTFAIHTKINATKLWLLFCSLR